MPNELGGIGFAFIPAIESIGIECQRKQPQAFHHVGLARIGLADEDIYSAAVQIHVFDGLEVLDLEDFNHQGVTSTTDYSALYASSSRSVIYRTFIGVESRRSPVVS